MLSRVARSEGTDMTTVTVSELRRHIERVCGELAMGRAVILTRHGKPIAALKPLDNSAKTCIDKIRPFDVAWPDIEDTLRNTKPKHRSWQEAEDTSRRRV